jgi:hypothetical protein
MSMTMRRIEMKSQKKKVAFPRRTWHIKPVTRVKDSLNGLFASPRQT